MSTPAETIERDVFVVNGPGEGGAAINPRDEEPTFNRGEEKPMSHPQTWDFAKKVESTPTVNAGKGPAPTMRETVNNQQPNDQGVRPLGAKTWAFDPEPEPCTNCDDDEDGDEDDEMVVNDDEEQPMSNRTWEF